MYFHWNDWMVNTTVAAIICVHRNNRVFYYLFYLHLCYSLKGNVICNYLWQLAYIFFFTNFDKKKVSSFNGLHFTDLQSFDDICSSLWHNSSAILTRQVHIRLILYRWHRHGKLTLGGGAWRLNGTNWIWGTEEDWFLNPRLKPV